MAAPNLLALTTVTPSSINVAPAVTTVIQLITNAAASASVCRVHSLYVANISTTTAYNVTINYYSQAALAGTAYAICSTVSIAPNAGLVVINRDSNIYMLENTSLGIICSTANVLVATCTWDVCS